MSASRSNTLRTLIHYQATLSSRIEEMLIESGGEIVPEIDTLLKALEICQGETLPLKVDSIRAVMDKSERMAEYYSDYEAMFNRLKKGWQGIHQRLKDYVKFNMIAWGMDELVGEHFSYKLVNGNDALQIDTEKLPASYLMAVTTMVPDKDRIKKDLQSGVSIPGAELVPGKSLRKGAAKK